MAILIFHQIDALKKDKIDNDIFIIDDGYHKFWSFNQLFNILIVINFFV